MVTEKGTEEVNVLGDNPEVEVRAEENLSGDNPEQGDLSHFDFGINEEDSHEDIWRKTSEKHEVLEELLRKVFQENEEVLSKRIKEDVVVEIKGYDFVHILNSFLTLKDHNVVLRNMVLQLEHLLKTDDIGGMNITKYLIDTFVSLDLEDKLEEDPDAHKEFEE